MAAPAQSVVTTEPAYTRGPSIVLRVHPALPLFVLEPGVVAQQLTDTTIAPVPNCASWFRGVARHGGQIVPFFDIARWVGVDRLDERGVKIISLTAGPHVLGLLASESPMVLPAGHPVVHWLGKDGLLANKGASETACQFDPSTWLAEIAASVAAESR
jgi:hypothetical protein